MGRQRKSKAPVLADCTFYYGPIKEQALLGMQIPGEVKVHKKMKKNSPSRLKQLLEGDSLHRVAH